MRHRRDDMGMTDAEIAQIVADEWSRPMGAVSKADTDAFDYFASCEQSQPKSELITYVFGALVTSAMSLFVCSLVDILAGVSTAWALGFALTACVLLFVAVLLGTFSK
jgi:hypothetical protein